MGRKKVEKIKTKCLQCGKEFEVYPNSLAKGRGKFCSISCGTKFRDLTNNPSKCDAVRVKISENHADVSGENNPMYGRRGKDAPSYIDGRSSFTGETYRRILKASGREEICAICGSTENMNIHHKDGDHSNNSLENLEFLCAKCHLTKAHTYRRNELGQFIGSELADYEMEVVL